MFETAYQRGVRRALVGWVKLSETKRDLTEARAREVGEEIGIDWTKAEFPVDEFRRGILVEYEHGLKDPQTNVTDDNLPNTARIAWAHLKEMKDYYTRLAKMEAGA